ncbi:MAG: glycine zipper 2TM domain-containing protein [Burkholderiales bacterium]|nr:glycine zipper 2TM domain-containing protein [Burkholderiales bacterium]
MAQSAPPAAPATTYTDTAQVLSAQPIYERNNVPRQECANEVVTETRAVPSAGYTTANYAAPQPAAPAPTAERTVGAGTVIGAIIGGVLGHQLGNSSGGRDRGTLAGAVVGGFVGNQIDNAAPSSAPAAPVAAAPSGRVDYVPEQRTVQRCRTVYDGRDEIVGYNVVYRYQGRDYTQRMAYDPGPTMNVRVNLAPEPVAPSAPRR